MITNDALVTSQPASGGLVATTYRADILNFGNPLGGVVATVTSSNPFNVRIAPGQGTLNFGPMPAGGQITSSNTFTILVNPSVPADFGNLQWTFQITPAPPIANPGQNQTVSVGSTVTLDGSGSTNPSGVGTLTYSWVLTTRPAGSFVNLFHTTSAQPTFVASAPGTYVITLTVSNGVSSGSASVTVVAGP